MEIEVWKKHLEDVLTEGQGKPHNLYLRHLDRVQLTILTGSIALFTVKRHPSFFGKSRMSFYTSAYLPVTQHYALDFAANKLSWLGDVAGDPVINWEFLISEEVGQLKHEGRMSEILLEISHLNHPEDQAVREVIGRHLAKVDYPQIVRETGILYEASTILADEVQQRLLQRLLAIINSSR